MVIEKNFQVARAKNGKRNKDNGANLPYS